MKRFSPGDLSIELPSLSDGDADGAIARASGAFAGWKASSLEQRVAALKRAQELITAKKDELARGIALEVGKPLTEAMGEVGAVIAKIDWAIADARQFLADQKYDDNALPNIVRRRPRGVAGVIGPFNFPLHLGHGAITAYLLAGNTVVYKPSPFAQGVCELYGELMRQAFPAGVFECVQGGADVGRAIVQAAAVRSVCFTGSVPAGKAIARDVAGQLGKDVALELGGKNATIVRADADLDLAASAIADAMCLTAGQRCNATSRVLVDENVEADLIARLRVRLAAYVPGDPLKAETKLGPVVSAQARERYIDAIQSDLDWLVRGDAPDRVDGKAGHYVAPAVARVARDAEKCRLFVEEVFAPLLVVVPTHSDDEAIALNNATPFGLTTSVFTADRARFLQLSQQIDCGNVYLNLPTTLSPSTLPFGGLRDSGNGRPGGRGFVRFASDEQVVQMKA